MALPRQGNGGIDLATYTAHYGLHQWEGSDDFLRTDFNTDFGIIDGALGEKAEVVTGSYSGNGTYPREISMGLMPRAVALFSTDGSTNAGNGTIGGLFAPELDLKSGSTVVAEVTADGFRLVQKSNNYYGVNASGLRYYYCVFL